MSEFGAKYLARWVKLGISVVFWNCGGRNGGSKAMSTGLIGQCCLYGNWPDGESAVVNMARQHS